MDKKITNATENIGINRLFEQLKQDCAIPDYIEQDPIVIRLERRIEEKDRIIGLLVGILDKIMALENWPNSASGNNRPEITHPNRENAPEAPSRSSDVENLRWVNPEGVNK